MRVYLPTTTGGLRGWHDDGIAQPPLAGWAVTPEVRRMVDAGDEEAEYAVASAAAAASSDLATGDGVARRIVVVAEVPDDAVVVDASTAGAVTVTQPVGMGSVASVLADPEPRPSEAHGAGEDDAHDLGWFGVQEIATLLA